MSKELTVVEQGGVINYTDPRMIATLKQTVAQGATDAEFAMFTEFCKSTGLNPFKKEIWFIKAGGRVQMMTGIQGFLAIANSHPQYDGMTVEVDNDESPTKAVCKVYRKDRRIPAEGVALMKEYRKDTPIWRQMPRVMLTKVAKSIALREAFPQELNGLYTQEEMPAEYSVQAAPVVAPAVTVEPIVQPKEERALVERSEYIYDTTALTDETQLQAEDLLQAMETKGVHFDPEIRAYVSVRALKFRDRARQKLLDSILTTREEIEARRKARAESDADDIPAEWSEESDATASA